MHYGERQTEIPELLRLLNRILDKYNVRV